MPPAFNYDKDMNLYNLYIVSASGFYTAIQGARPTPNVVILRDALGTVEAVRPGRGRYYELLILPVTEDWQPSDESLNQIYKMQEKLLSL